MARMTVCSSMCVGYAVFARGERAELEAIGFWPISTWSATGGVEESLGGLDDDGGSGQAVMLHVMAADAVGEFDVVSQRVEALLGGDVTDLGGQELIKA